MRWNCLFAALMVALFSLVAHGDEKTSKNNPQLKAWLEQFPEADTNEDGVLTLSEAKAYQQNRRSQLRTSRG